jgi:DNA topoisomerase-1
LTGKRVGDRYLTEGAILQERAFLSTSSEEVGAFRSQKDIGGRGPVTLLEIEVPKGFRAFPLEGRQTGAFLPSQGQARENELLFPRGTKMQVLSVDKEARRAKVRLIAETEGSRRNAATVALVDAIASRRPTVPRKGNPYVRGYKVGRKFLLSSLLKAGYRPDQRRAPKGSSEGGQWTAGPNYHYDKDAGGWVDAQGKLLSAKVIERLKKLRVPPGWQGVVLNPDLQAALQAIGFDTKGRKQYLYSAEHSERAAAEKFARLQEFSKHLPRMRTLIESWLTNTKLSYKDRDAAAVLRMIERTGIRIGGTAETLAAAKAYGAATLLVSHVSYSGDRIKLDFIGKKGVRNERAFTDKELAAYIRERKGRRSTGSLWEVSPGYVRTAFERMGFSDFSPKDFRTWHGTSQALLEVKRHPKPRTDKEMKKLRTAVGKHVAAYLGNTPAVALSSYVDPAVFRSRL